MSGAAGGGYAQVVPMEEINLHLLATFMQLHRHITFSHLSLIIIFIGAMNLE